MQDISGQKPGVVANNVGEQTDAITFAPLTANLPYEKIKKGGD